MAIIKVFNVNLGHNKGYCLTFCSQKFLMTDLGLSNISTIDMRKMVCRMPSMIRILFEA